MRFKCKYSFQKIICFDSCTAYYTETDVKQFHLLISAIKTSHYGHYLFEDYGMSSVRWFRITGLEGTCQINFVCKQSIILNFVFCSWMFDMCLRDELNVTRIRSRLTPYTKYLNPLSVQGERKPVEIKWSRGQMSKIHEWNKNLRV